MTLNTPPSIAPHIKNLLRGFKLQDISFVDHPPAKWSWNLAIAMSAAILDPGTKMYWSRHQDKGIEELATWLGQTWTKRSKGNLDDFPEIFPHALALFETLLMRSQPALIRLYGNEGAKVAHYVAQGIMRQGIEQHPSWMKHYYDMRQSIETDDTLQSHINQYVSNAPLGWTREKEFQYQRMNQKPWPSLPVHPPMESSMEWFNPTTMAIMPIRTVVNSHSSEADGVDEINGVPYEGLRLRKKGSIEITGLLGQSHEVSYVFDLSFSPAAVAGARPLHAHVAIEPSSNISDDASLQQMHAMTMAHAITKSLDSWLHTGLVKEQTATIKFEPSVTVECALRDPAANQVWLDTVQEHVQQFMQESFKLPIIESSPRKTM